MNKVAIITDSNAGISPEEAKELGVQVVPMPFTINDEDFLEGITMTQDEFYKKLESDPEIFTSQPSLAYLEDLWAETLKTYKEIIYIPMSSSLSGSYSAANILAQNFDNKVLVVKNKRISVTQKESVIEALYLASKGKKAADIKAYLEETCANSRVYIMVSTLKYLKKGGRISPAAAAIGSLLKIKPILYNDGGKFEKLAMCLTSAQGRKKIIDQIKKDFSEKFKEEYENNKIVISVAHTQNEAEALKMKDELIKAFPKATFKFVDPLSLSVACHIGPGALGIAFSVNNYLQ